MHGQVKADPLIFPVKESGDQDQVAGAGNGQKLGQSLQNA